MHPFRAFNLFCFIQGSWIRINEWIGVNTKGKVKYVYVNNISFKQTNFIFFPILRTDKVLNDLTFQ